MQPFLGTESDTAYVCRTKGDQPMSEQASGSQASTGKGGDEDIACQISLKNPLSPTHATPPPAQPLPSPPQETQRKQPRAPVLHAPSHAILWNSRTQTRDQVQIANNQEGGLSYCVGRRIDRRQNRPRQPPNGSEDSRFPLFPRDHRASGIQSARGRVRKGTGRSLQLHGLRTRPIS